MQLFHVGHRHVLWHRWSLFSLAWQKRFSCKGRELKTYSCGFNLLSEPWIWVFQAFICQTMSNNYIKACSTIVYAPLTKSNNKIIDLWRCYCSFHSHFIFILPFVWVWSVLVQNIPGLLSLLICFCVFLFSDCLDCDKPTIFKWKILVRQDCRLILIHWKTIFIYVFHFLAWQTR